MNLVAPRLSPLRRRLGILCVLVTLAALGCAKPGGPGANAPEGAGTMPGAPTGGGSAVIGPDGQQYSVSDAPSSGEEANRPKMNAKATQAYLAGMEAFRNGDLESARTQLLAATKADAKAYQAFYSLGTVRERLGEKAGAQTMYRKALQVVPDYEPAIVSLALIMARSNRPDEAESILRDYQAKMPKSAAVVAALAEVKSIGGDSTEAQRLAQEALKKNPDYRPAMVTLARDHYRNRRLDLAMYALRGILDGYGDENPPRDENNAEARLIRGLIFKEQGNKQGAIDEFKKAIALRPDLVEARVQLAAYYLESGNATDAVPLLEAALRYDKNNVMAHLDLGDAYRLLGKAAEARRELEWVLDKDPNIAEAHYNLGLLYLFSDGLPGVKREAAPDLAIASFEAYKKKKPRNQAGAPDDTDELITRAKTKKALIEAEQAQPAPPPPPPPASGDDAKPGSSTGSLPPAE
jgi:Tfp pilus assembly protein PilF